MKILFWCEVSAMPPPGKQLILLFCKSHKKQENFV